MNLKRVISGPLLSVVFLIFFAYIIFGVQLVLNNIQENRNDMVLGSVLNGTENIVPQEVVVTPENVQPAPVIEINAKSAISVESNLYGINKIIIDQNSDTKLSIASLTKLMTAVIVLDNYNLSDNIVVDEIADSQDPMKQDVKLGDKMPVESFLDIMLIRSSNKAAYALSEGPGGYPGIQKFVILMNQKAKDIGMRNTSFVDPTGLSAEDISTAQDLVKLAEYILKNKEYSKILDISKLTELNVPGFGDVKNTDELLNEIPDIVCSKTGFTEEAKGCLLLVINNPKNNDYLINVVLGVEMISGVDQRFIEMKKIINWSSTTCTQPTTN